MAPPNMSFDQREAHIKQQAARKRRLLKLVQIFHRCRSGSFDDYAESYEDFYTMYLAPRAELDIPRYASCAEDESYGMITMLDSLMDALSDQADIPGNGEYLNVPAGIYDLDSRGTKQIETRTVTLTNEAYTVLCGLVQPNWMTFEPPHDKDAINHGGINHGGIYSDCWDELQAAFPIETFREAAEQRGKDFYNEEAGL